MPRMPGSPPDPSTIQASQLSVARVLTFSLFLVAIAVFLYRPSTRFQFVNYDDNLYINSHVQQGITLDNIRWAFSTFTASNWHPLTWLSHMMDSQLFGSSPSGPHLVNFVLHALNGVLIFVLLCYGTHRLWPSWMVAALFLVHPANVGSVAWIAERKNMLSMLFALLALAAYGWYAAKPSWRRYCLIMAAFAASLMSKPMLVTLPLMLLLIDFWPLRRCSFTQNLNYKILLLEKLPLFALSLASSMITLAAQTRGGAMRGTIEFPLRMRIENALVSFSLYIGKMLWPFHFSIFYPYPSHPWKLEFIVLCGFLLASISVSCIWLRRRCPYFIVGWLWYLIALIPVAGIIQVGNQSMADRYLYAPVLGVFLALVWGAAEALSHLHVHRSFAVFLSVAALSLLFWDSRNQLRYWHDSVSLWSHADSVVGNDPVVMSELGAAYLDSGQPAQAVTYFGSLASANPAFPYVFYNLGNALFESGAVQDSRMAFFSELQHASPQMMAQTYKRIAETYFAEENIPSSEKYLEIAHTLAPRDFEIDLEMGRNLQRMSNTRAAIQAFSESLRGLPTDYGFLHLGECLQETGDLKDAGAAYEQALKIAVPGSAAAKESSERLHSVEELMRVQKPSP